MKNKNKYTIIIINCLLLSTIFGILTNDLLIGGTTLATGLLCAYLASEGRKANYIFGLINYLLMGYVSFKNNLYGIFFFFTSLSFPPYK